MVMKRTNPILRNAFRSGAGVHQRSQTGLRQILDKQLEDDIEEYLSDGFEELDEVRLYRQQLD